MKKGYKRFLAWVLCVAMIFHCRAMVVSAISSEDDLIDIPHESSIEEETETLEKELESLVEQQEGSYEEGVDNEDLIAEKDAENQTEEINNDSLSEEFIDDSLELISEETAEETDEEQIPGSVNNSSNSQIILNDEEISIEAHETYRLSAETVPENLEYTWSSEDEDVFVIEKGVLVRYNGTDENIVIPDGVTSIGEGTFKCNKDIKSVRFPRDIETIEAEAFAECPNLEEVTIPKGVKFKSLYNKDDDTVVGVFQNSKIKNLYFEDGTEEIDAGMLYNATIENIYIPEEVTRIITEYHYDGILHCYLPSGAVIHGNPGSYAEEYAKEHHHIFVSTEEPTTWIRLNYENITTKARKTTRLVAETYPNNLEYTWGSEDESIATIDENGEVLAGYSKGSCRVYAKAKDGSTIAFCTVTVRTNWYVVKNLEDFQSPHNYEKGCEDVWEYTDPGKRHLAITFSEESEVEHLYDRISVWDGADRLYETYKGDELAGKTVIVDGDTVRVKMDCSTYASETAYGFRVVSITSDIKNSFVIERGVLLQYSGKEKDIVIPYGVKSIAEGAFRGNRSIKSVKIPDSVEYIGKYAFIMCESLADVDLGKGIKHIEECAFGFCRSLTSIVIPKNVQVNGYSDPLYCQGHSVFVECSSLETVIFEEGTVDVSAVCCGSYVREVVIPESVRTISHAAFLGCQNLEEIKLPKNLEIITTDAFSYCDNLKKITIPKGVKYRHINFSGGNTMPTGIFEGDRIKELYFEEGTEEIDAGMLYNSSVENIYIPKEVTQIIIQSNYYGQRNFYLPSEAIIHGEYGSYAEEYAKEYHHKFIGIGEVQPLPKKLTELSIEGIADAEYCGIQIQPKPVIRDGDSILEEGKHYSLSYDTINTFVGIGSVTISCIPGSGYEGYKTLNFNIIPFDISMNNNNRIVLNYDKKVEFSKDGAKPKVTVSFKNADGTIRELTEGRDYTLSYRNNLKYNRKVKPTIIIAANGNFTGSKEVQFSLTERKLAKTKLSATDRLWINIPDCYKTMVFICDSNTLLIPGDDYEIGYAYESKTVVKVAGKKVTRKAGETVGKRDVIPADTTIRVTATAKKGSGYTGTVTTTYKLYSLQTLIKCFFG